MAEGRQRQGSSRPIYYGPRGRPTKERLPPSGGKFSPQNPPFLEQQVDLISNAYALNVKKVDLIVHEYELTVAPSAGFKDLPSQIVNRNFVSTSIRKLIMDEIVPRLLNCRNSKGSVVIETHLEAIYSLKLFRKDPNRDSSESTLDGSIIFRNIPVLTSQLLSQLNVDIAIKYIRPLQLNLSEQNILMAIMHHKLLLNMWRYGSVFYSPHNNAESEACREARLDLISQHLMGISVSGIRRSANDQSLVVVNCSHAYITRSHRLIDLLAAFIAEKPVDPVYLDHSVEPKESGIHKRSPEIASIVGTEVWFQSFVSILNGFKCWARESGQDNKLKFELSEQPASELKMNDITVQEYYKRLGLHLNYPNLPCLKSRSNRLSYYPIELCSLLPGQKVPIFRLSSSARNHLSILNKPKPDQSKRFSSTARGEVVAMNTEEFKNFGISLSETPVEARGSSLQRPVLAYQDQLFEPKRDFWESGVFHHAMNLIGNWCVVNTVAVEKSQEETFFQEFSRYCNRFGFVVGRPHFIESPKEEIIHRGDGISKLVEECQMLTEGRLRFIMFVIDSSSTPLNRLVHLSFNEHLNITATCLRVDSIMNGRQQKSIFRTLVHKLNARLGGTNVIYHKHTLDRLSLRSDELMIIGLDVTHPDNELSGVSIVGCAYTYSKDLFRHRSLVWPQGARVEIIGKVDTLMKRLVNEYILENKGRLPGQIIVYRDGVSHEEFDKVRAVEVSKAQIILDETAKETGQSKPNLSYIIAQKRHTMRFFRVSKDNVVSNPSSGTLIDQDIVSNAGREFYLYSNTSPQATARPLHYHVLVNGLGIENLQKLTYFLCFNFGKCSGTLSMPSSLRYAHNAAYDARNRVIASKEFKESKFYTSKFFC